MAKVKQGGYLSCDVCGLVVVVDEACGCATADVICCDKPMIPGKAAANKAKKKAGAPKPAAKAMKTAAKAKPAKAAAKAKPAKKAAAKAKPAPAKK